MTEIQLGCQHPAAAVPKHAASLARGAKEGGTRGEGGRAYTPKVRSSGIDATLAAKNTSSQPMPLTEYRAEPRPHVLSEDLDMSHRKLPKGVVDSSITSAQAYHDRPEQE